MESLIFFFFIVWELVCVCVWEMGEGKGLKEAKIEGIIWYFDSSLVALGVG